MKIELLDGTLLVEVNYCLDNQEFEDDICLTMIERCPDDERIFRADETNLLITPAEAVLIIRSLEKAVQASLNHRESRNSND